MAAPETSPGGMRCLAAQLLYRPKRYGTKRLRYEWALDDGGWPMDERWYMVLDCSSDTWNWCLISTDVRIMKRSEQSFARYSDAYEDARRHGCVETPALATVEHGADTAVMATIAQSRMAHERGRMAIRT